MASELAVTEHEIRAEHVRNLFAETASTVVAHVITGSTIAVYLWLDAARDTAAPLLWLAALIVACAMRLAVLARFRREPEGSLHWRTWGRIGTALSGVFGAIWGGAILLFLDLDKTGSAILLSVIPIGMAAAASGRNAPVPQAFAAFEVPITLSLTLVLVLSHTLLGYLLGGLVLFTSVQRFVSAWHLHGILDRALRLGFENLALRREAERSNAAKTRFLAAASHDLRQPIHALGLSFSALLPHLSGSRTAPLARQVESCIEAIRQMLEALLDVSKLDAGVVKPELSQVDLQALLGRLMGELTGVAEQTGNRLRLRIGGAPRVYTDPAMLESILRNLVGNALRYTSKGQVLVAVRRRGWALRIEVWDTGIGIPEDQLEEVFVEFRQLHNPQRDRGSGLGLGLAIVKRLAALLDHPLEVRSRLGRGSCFRISVPRATGPAPDGPASEPRAPLAPATGEDATVLVLDDDPDVRAAMATLLGVWGYRVLLAGTIGEAMDLAAREGFDLLVVDYRLPDDTTGAEAIDALQHRRGAPIPALVITGDTAPDRLREAGELGLPLLHKPVHPAKLRAALRQLGKR